MNKIETLIKERCPNGVEWREVGEVANVGTGNNNTNEQVEEGEYPFFVRSKSIKRISTYSYDEKAIIIPGEGGIGEIFHYIDGKYGLHQRAYRIHFFNTKINTKFIYYYMQANFKSFIMKKAVSATVQSIRKPMIEKFKIPIPPLEIQEEIVKILDKFTDYVTELTTELTLRQKQYNYYRDKLLSFEETLFEVKKKRIGDILIKGKGTKITASQMKSLHQEGNPIRIFAGGKTFADIDYGDIPEKDVHEETAIIVKSRGIIDFEYYSKPFSFKNEFWSYSSIDENINLRYIYHYLKYNKNHFQNIANNMQMPQISSSDTENYLIPIPKIEIQSRIVKVLDNFDTVCNDLNIGLPKEIKLRQKQYEFFRDKLLTFAAEGVYTDSTVQTRHN
ncbi:restriction endonuclease subunit S [Streptococcus uberis]|uniref:restriction endonuclease subunit S n=1 Tax=Streptococcus uberis TaxID=1349 RepID=UPI003D77AFF9